MPKYTYECGSCDAIFEYRHGMADVLVKCVECDSDQLEKRISDFSLDKKECSTQKETGSEVKRFIEEARKEIKEERSIV